MGFVIILPYLCHPRAIKNQSKRHQIETHYSFSISTLAASQVGQ
ncbi:hypothetical protein VCHC61A2_1941 [Vibrio cholerae HC-61A2]|nr:hypothetical protein VCHC43B1_1970 [Vibrio cholerae HC-43B1]EKK96403.1 hypothetical protein VCHC1A2_0707 [Vibrio cholerae HC-1A2]EKL13918.1 hypothetical protein VCHC60A1_1568 [Vibrio cholerae HC-60A1]EKL21896.1 hypothetical protein VCHC61A2_1941 [Vibrio cholerae HC-61A2]EKL93109.1 hypothetical protein VCHC02C1_1575 [Vibrio cholerae HC-02C1]EKM07783.1 hypothetical protein VCHC59B1_1408 [Vibrio cholerae HC-59B1]ELT18180.1 hypothetical protein VCHC78A1_01418 [Vibrio cholerae HC-78A1]ERP68753